MKNPSPVTQESPLKGRIIYLTVIMILVQFLYPFSSAHSTLHFIVYQLFYISLFAAGIHMVRGHIWPMRALIFATISWIAVSAVYILFPHLEWANITGYVLVIFFQGSLIFILVHFIFQTRTVNRDVLLASMTIYLLIGEIFVPVYGIIESTTWYPEQTTHAFVDLVTPIEGQPIPWQTLVYYSFSTLTTLGYGDIVPANSWARSVASLQAVIGVLYTAVIVARLVGLYAAREIDEG